MISIKNTTTNRVWFVSTLCLFAFSVTVNATANESNIVFTSKNIGEHIQSKLPAGIEILDPGKPSATLCLKSKKSVSLFLNTIPVKPDSSYNLTFEAKIDGPGSGLKFNPTGNNENGLPYWEIRVLDAKGRLPHEGHFKNIWQRCFSGNWRVYRQSFRTPPAAKELRIIFANGSGRDAIMIKNIKLEKIIAENLLLNSDFSGGKFDYSGWSELSRAELIEEKGETKLEIKTGGYALTYPVPISPGKYIFAGRRG